MKKLFLLISSWFVFLTMNAHSSDVSSAFLVKKGNIWSAQVSTSLAAFQYEMMEEMSKEQIKKLGAQEIEKWILDNFKKSFVFKVNGEKIEFGKGHVKLGHEVQIKILLKNMPNEVYELIVNNKHFLNSSGLNHKTYFKTVIEDKMSERYKISLESKHMLKLTDVYLKPVKESAMINILKNIVLPISLSLSFILLLAFLIIQTKNEKSAIVT